MKGDFSRWGFKAADNFTGVLYQQGRVFVDQDGNAETQIENQLRTTLAQDAIGPDTAAVPAAYPDSLKVTQVQATASEVRATFKPGRLWADGVPLVIPGSADITLKASYLGPPIQAPQPVLGSIAAGVRDALILEVWEESFSAYQDPAQLLEPALGGVDTTERIKVAYALKLLRLNSSDDCGNLAARLADDFSSKGKLSVTPSATVTISGDCPVEAGGGYSGFEHYLYRIEVAEPDGSGNARFKWSQFNAGLVGRGDFTSSGATTGTVHIKANNQAINRCGLPSFYLEALAYDADLGYWRVVFRADAALTQDDELSLSNITPDSVWPASVPDTAFFRLWNGIALMSAFPIPAGSTQPNPLKDDIRLAFDAPASGKYTPGDYWTFPVRAAGAPVDAAWIAANWPNNAPPQGVHQHRVPLAILNWSGAVPVTITAAADQIADCRRVFQPLTRLRGCCRYTVGDGMQSFGDFDTIQAAINALPVSDGGEICVLPGQYNENLLINKDNVTIKGCGRRSQITGASAGQPVIKIVDAEHTRIEALRLVAHVTGPGVLVQDTPVSHDITLRGLHIHNAAARAAIEVQAGEFVTIEDCRVRMNDIASPWPAVFVTADDVRIERNVIQVQHAVGALPTAGRGGLQLGGTSDRVRVIDNLIEAGIGNGITLGTLQEVNANGTTGGIIGWVVDANDPCNPCDPGDIYIPPSSGGAGVPTYQSAGALYDVLIERNRILDMGLNGIGVVAFFNLSAQDEFISVERLRIVANEIIGCLRRPLATIDASMIDAMGYGGIALADVEYLSIHRNLIESNGQDHLEPVCGVFVLHGEGIEISDNRIHNNGIKTAQPSHTAKNGRRGGINIVLAVAPVVPTPILGNLYPVQNGTPAAKIHDNVVSQPLGQALSLTALGPVSVVNNHLTSRGMVLKLNPMSPSFLATTVMVLNLGVSMEWYGQLGAFSGVLYGSMPLTGGPAMSGNAVLLARQGLDDKRVGEYLANGNVLFTDNRVDLDLLETGLGFALSSILILSLDDVAFQDNQCDCNLLDDFIISQAILFGISLRASDNRFKEGLFNAILSAVTVGLLNATTNNQSTHCLLVWGLLASLKIDSGNRALVDGLVKGYCERLFPALAAGGFKLMATGA
jgi:hypothetical protein